MEGQGKRAGRRVGLVQPRGHHILVSPACTLGVSSTVC